MILLRRLRAFLGCYFWLPCPVCGRMFGGFEIAENGLMTTGHSGKAVCKKCNLKVLEVNKKNFEDGKIDCYFERVK
ncbi:MAG: hypothetical protein V3V81_07860 [Candidatus Bathyarchaeia archaeon]